MENRKKVFISYSWDGTEHQEWVLNLAKDLIEKFGVDIILDQFELSAGKDLTHFMENSIMVADKVLVILTPNYKVKAENREKGVGYETSMISKEIFESPISKVKFIPILRSGTQSSSSPKFLSSKLYHEMSDDLHYINKIYELSRVIYDKPLIEKPELGPIPNSEKLELLDPIIDMANAIVSKERINQELDKIIDSRDGAQLFVDEVNKLAKELEEKAKFYGSNSEIEFGFEKNRLGCIISCGTYSVAFSWQHYSNSATHSELLIRYFWGVVHLEPHRYYYFKEPKQLKDEKYKMDLDYSKNFVWKNQSRVKTSAELQQDAILFMIEKISEEKSKNFRK